MQASAGATTAVVVYQVSLVDGHYLHKQTSHEGQNLADPHIKHALDRITRTPQHGCKCKGERDRKEAKWALTERRGIR